MMIVARIKGVNTVRKRLADGSVRVYYYHRDTGKRLPGEPGSSEFIAAYHDADRSISERSRGTLAGLIREFEDSPDFSNLAESTQREYRRMFAKIEDAFGTMPIGAIEDRRARGDFLSWRDEHARTSPREADHRLSALARVLAWHVDRGSLSRNVLTGFRRVHRADRSDKVWLPEHVQAFWRVAGLEMQLALMLALHTAQRQGDLLRLPWSAYDGATISLRQGKTGRAVKVNCTKALRRALDAAPRRGLLILTTKTGRPWKKRYFNKVWTATCANAGIEGLHFHDLRGTAITMLSEAGNELPAIAAVSGHSLRRIGDILDKYLARTAPLAEQAIIKFENYSGTEFANRLQTGPVKVDKEGCK